MQPHLVFEGFVFILNENNWLIFNSEMFSLSSGESGSEAPCVSGRKSDNAPLMRAQVANIAVGIRGEISARTPRVVARI